MFPDRGELFSMDPRHANVYAPVSALFTPLFQDSVMKTANREAFGVMGGGSMPQGHVQVLTNQIDFGLNVQETGDASPLEHEGDNEPTGEKMNASGGYVEARERYSVGRRCASRAAIKGTTSVSTSAVRWL